MDRAQQPRVRRNDWRTLQPPSIGQWTPALSVSVVIPAYNAHQFLPVTLASLSAQSYPDELLEVIVVDDGSQPPLELPEIRPTRTRIVRTTESWGRAHACAVGAQASNADVIHWLDADMLVYRHHVEAQMRWHHLVDYAVVLGHKMFVDPEDREGGLPGPEEVREATLVDGAEKLFDGLPVLPHDWVEAFWERTDEMCTAGPTAWTVHVGATASVSTELYRASGGMDSALKLGEDTELGYRLSQVGAVFIPERQARSWHLGPSTVMRRRDDVIRYNAPYLTDRVSQLRYRRSSPGRRYSVPYVQAVVDVSSATWEQAQATIDGLLANVDVDLECLAVGSWSLLDDERCSPLADPRRELRMIAAAYRGEARVRLVEESPRSAFPAAFRLDLPAGWRAAGGTIAPLLKRMESEALGRVSILMPDGTVAALERTAAASRTDRVIRPDEDRADVMDSIYGSWWSDGPDVGFRWWEDPQPKSLVAEQGREVARLRKELATSRKRLESLEKELAARSDPRRTHGRSFPWMRNGSAGVVKHR